MLLGCLTWRLFVVFSDTLSLLQVEAYSIVLLATFVFQPILMHADWAGSVSDRRSTYTFTIAPYCTFVGDNLVTWRSKKQSVVARSSAEAEYRSMALAACELTWLKHFMIELGIDVSAPMEMFCDNQAAIHIAANPVFHERTKLI